MSDEEARAIKAYEDVLTRVIIRSREPDMNLEMAAKIDFYEVSIAIEKLKLGSTREYWDAVMRAQDAANEYFRRVRQAALK